MPSEITQRQEYIPTETDTKMGCPKPFLVIHFYSSKKKKGRHTLTAGSRKMSFHFYPGALV